MSHNPVKPERSRHIDIKKYFLRDLVRDKVVKLLKCPGPQNVADALTKSVPGPTLAKHRQWLLGTNTQFKVHCASQLVAYLATFMSEKHILHPWGTRVPFSACFAALSRAQDLAKASLTQPHSARASGG